MLIAMVNWADNCRRAIQGETVIDNRVVVPIAHHADNCRMIVVLGNSDGNGDGDGDGNRGNNSGGGDAVSDAAVTLMAAQSAANGRPDGNNGSAAIPMQ
jgi:hypothetical protein